jgi:hypothetical protein
MHTIKYNNFNTENLHFSTPKGYYRFLKYSKWSLQSDPIYFINGYEVAPQIQSPWINLDTYGFPGGMDKYGKPLSEFKLHKLKVPLSLNNAETNKFYKLLSEIDKKCEDDQEKIWGDKANLYRYKSIVCKSHSELEDEEQKPDYITLNFKPFFWPSSQNTKVFLNIDGVRSEVETPTLDDVKKYVRDKCEFRTVFSLDLFGSQVAYYSDFKLTYGLELVLRAIEVKPMISITL